MVELHQLKAEGEAPHWLTDEALKTLKTGYLQDGESPRGMYQRVANAAGSYYKDSAYWSGRFFDAMWNNWLCLATPVATNMGGKRGLPISCNGIDVPDDTFEIFNRATELAMLSKQGAGVALYLGRIRGRGAPIRAGGVSEGVIPWAKLYDTTTASVSQGSTRRGASALYLDVTHRDIEEFLDIRRATGDVNRRCLNINQGVNITDPWMTEMLKGDQSSRDLWKRILTTRVETGEPYIFFSDTVNRANPECYKAHGLSVKFSNLCTEIMLHTDDNHSFICCLSSLNVARYDEWKDTDLPNVAARFLDAVLEEYIFRASSVRGLKNSVASAIAGRALGIGVLGWHTYLQQNGIPFDSFESMRLNAEIFRNIKTKAHEESRKMAIELGEPEWCRGFGMRNTHLMAVAPTLSNSTISGGVSAGIEPILANCYTQEGAQGTFFRTNAALEAILETRGRNDPATWKSIVENQGSVQHLDCLFGSEKEVFLTAREINQFAIIKQASQRQKYIDQGQSVNLFFASNAPPKYVHDVHVEAWRAGLKTLYYCKSKGVLKGDMASRSKNECAACEG